MQREATPEASGKGALNQRVDFELGRPGGRLWEAPSLAREGFGAPYTKGDLLASGLPGIPGSPQLPVALGALLPARELWAQNAGFVAFGLLNGAGLTQFRV